MKIIHIGGAKGVGKTTTLHTLASYPVQGFTLKSIGISTFLFELAEVTYHQPWRDLSDEQRSAVRAQLKPALLRLPYDALLLDSHYIDMIEGVPTPIMPREVQEVIDVHIVLQAPVREILRRRQSDLHLRQRDLDQQTIAAECAAEATEAWRIAEAYERPCYVIPNLRIPQTIQGILTITEHYLSDHEGHITNETNETNASRVYYREPGEGRTR